MNNRSIGTYDIAKTARVVRASADGNPRYKPGGVTLDWGTVPIVNAGADTTWLDGTVVPAGRRALRYGTILSRILASSNYSEVVTASGGTRTISVSVDGGAPVTTGALAFDALAATIQTAVRALSNVGAGNATVTGTGPYVYDFSGGALATHNVVVTVGVGSLTGGTSTLTQVSAGSALTRRFGPYTSTAVDGRQSLIRGECFIVNETVLETDLKADHVPGGVFDGGLVFLARVLNNGTDLTTNPTRSAIETAFPAVTWVED